MNLLNTSLLQALDIDPHTQNPCPSLVGAKKISSHLSWPEQASGAASPGAANLEHEDGVVPELSTLT